MNSRLTSGLAAIGAAASLFAAGAAPAQPLSLDVSAGGDRAPARLSTALYTTGDAVRLQDAQYVWGGRNYCWYDGWRGPGWYWCGYGWRRGYGWGGGYGWHNWRGRGEWRGREWRGRDWHGHEGWRGGDRGEWRGGDHREGRGDDHHEGHGGERH